MTGNPDSCFIHSRERVDVFGAARSNRSYQSLRDSLGQQEFEHKKLNICIITRDFVGPVKNGGIGTAYTYAAKALVQAGHAVTVLYSVKNCVDKTLDYWIDIYKQQGINFIIVDDPEVPIQRGPSGDALQVTYCVYEWLKKHEGEFDFIHVSEWDANAYLCLQAKYTGLHFQNTRFVVKGSSPTLWNRIGNAEPIADVRSLALMFMERRSIEMADYVICGSQYLLNWMEDQGYAIPYDVSYVQPNIFPINHVDRESALDRIEVKELVFFGRIEPRKGIHFFVDALIQLKERGFFDSVEVPVISLLGKPRAGFDYKSQILRLEKQLNIEIQLLDNKNQPQALDYLSAGRGRVAVMPSLMDNSPFGVYECLSRAIPFITSTAGGGYELVSEGDRDGILFNPAPGSLADLIEEILEKGCPVAEPSFDFSQSIEDWMQWHLWAAEQPPGRLISEAKTEGPLVSVCMAHYNRGQLLENALKSLEKQTYNNVEIIVVDDGSTDKHALETLNRIESSEYRFPVTILREPNRYLGSVRNTGIHAAKGEYILFMDDDNEAKPEEIETFVNVAKHTGSEILTCFSDSFSGERPHRSKTKPRRITFHGENLALALIKNPLGDSNCFVRRESAIQLGGFTEHYKVGRDDVEFLSRAVLSGMRVTLVPKALYWYRINEERMRNSQYSLFSGLIRVAEPFTQGLHPDLANIIRYAQGLDEVAGDLLVVNGKVVARKDKLFLVRLYERVFSRPVSTKFIEFGRRVVYKYPFLYGLAARFHHRV